jgi:hypothetical protein
MVSEKIILNIEKLIKKSLKNMAAVSLSLTENKKIQLKGNDHYDKKDCNPLVSPRSKII